jgi:hypothetical protein
MKTATASSVKIPEPPPEDVLHAVTVTRFATGLATVCGRLGGGGGATSTLGGPIRQAIAQPQRRQNRDASGISRAQRGQRINSMPHLATTPSII